jgi:hypothetical protein
MLLATAEKRRSDFAAMKRALKITTLAICVLVLGYLLIGVYTVKTFRLRFSSPDASEGSRMAEIGKNLNELSRKVEKGDIPWRKIDRSSIGFPESEARLLTLRSAVDFFIGEFGHPPFEIGELDHLSELTGYPLDKLREIQNLPKNCEIVNLKTDSFILDCGAFSSLSTTEIDELLKSFDKETEKFYEVRGQVILYVPPPMRGKSPDVLNKLHGISPDFSAVDLPVLLSGFRSVKD